MRLHGVVGRQVVPSPMKHVWKSRGVDQKMDEFGAHEVYELWTCQECGFTWEDDEKLVGVPEEHPLIPPCEEVQVAGVQES